MIRFLLLSAFFTIFAPFSFPDKAAACQPHELEGNWTNVRANKKILNQLEIIDTCNRKRDAVRLKVRALEKCHPRNCSWGWSEIVDLGRGEYIAVFKTFTAQRRLEISTIGSRLRINVITDYFSPSRTDKTATHLLVRSIN